MHNSDRDSLTATTEDFLAHMATRNFRTPEELKFLNEALTTVANSLHLYDALPPAFPTLIEKLARSNPNLRGTIRLLIQPALSRFAPEASVPAASSCPSAENRATGTCEWSAGLLSSAFARHCGAPVATSEERAALHKELGYGTLQSGKASLCRSQPYCADHLRAGIRSAHKQVLD